MLNTILLATTMTALGLPVNTATQSADTIEVSSTRFFTPDGRTLVDGFVKIPFGMLTAFRSSTGTNVAMYRLQVEVTDENGFEMASTDWTGTVPQGFLSTSGASTVEHFSFRVSDGTYTASVTVVDSASGASVTSPITFLGYSSRPPVSDVMLTNALRRTSGEGDVAAPGEIRKGAFFLSGTPRPRLHPSEATLFYYVEFYTEAETTIDATARIMNSDGRVFLTTPTSSMNLSARGGVAARSLDLTGLPTGDYVMELEVSYPDTTLARSASFSVNSLSTVEASTPVAPIDPFAFQNEEVLDSLYAPLILLIRNDERGIYEHLSVEGKRNFLREFWESRDLTPGSPENEAMSRYYSAIAEANRRFGATGAGAVPGWRTDRGRIFLKYGTPGELLDEAGSGRTDPYEVWKYTRGRPVKFIFMDMSGFGHYELVFTDDRHEQGRIDWESLFEVQELERVKRF